METVIFKRYPIKLGIEAILISKDITRCYSEKAVRHFQQAAIRREEDQKRANFRQEHPVKSFLLRSVRGIVSILVLFIVASAALPQYGLLNVVVAMVNIIFCFLLIIWANVNRSKLRGAPWKSQPFNVFAGEYTGNVGGKISPCAATRHQYHNDANPERISLEVEYHDICPIRFLVAVNTNNPNEKFYVDDWKCPEPSA